MKIKMSIDSQSLDPVKSTIKQNGFHSWEIVPAGNVVPFEANFNKYYTSNISSVTNALNNTLAYAEGIQNQVTSLSNNLTTNYLSEADMFSSTSGQRMAATIKESTATFVTNEQAGGWYGLNISTDVNGKEYVAGFDIGAITNPNSGNLDSYFRINADKFIVGGDIGDGEFRSPEFDGSPLPVFSIEMDDEEAPQIWFNGKVNIASIPTSVNKYVGEFANFNEVNAWLSNNPDFLLSEGDTFRHTGQDVLYMWDGDEWFSAESELMFQAFVFKRSATKPSAPVGGNYENNIPSGWLDGIPASDPSKDAQDPVWVSSARFSNKEDYTANLIVWTEPEIMSDTETSDVMFNNLSSTPIAPTYSGDLTTVSTGDAANGWYNEATDGAVWTAHRRKVQGQWTSWYVYRVKGEDGVNGTPGSSGSRGSSIRSGSGSGGFPSTTATNAFSSVGGPIDGDQYIWSSDTDGTMIRTFSGSIWTNNVGLEVSGDAIISGTLSASDLVGGSLFLDNVNSKFGDVGALNVKGTVNFYDDGGYRVLTVDNNAVYSTLDLVVEEDITSKGTIYSKNLRASEYFQCGTIPSHRTTIDRGTFISNTVSCTGDINSTSGNLYIENINAKGSITSNYAGTAKAILQNDGNVICYYGGLAASGCMASGNVFGYTGTFSGNVTSGGTVLSFTGGHYILSDKDYQLGDILEIYDVISENINQTYPKVTIASVEKSKKVIGVLSGSSDKEVEEEECSIVNSVGEGMLNVCAANGDLESGDYICSSSVPGKGMKQDDDLMHNYTVAKALEDVVWGNEVVGENGCFEQDGIKCKMIACTYHCG